VVVATPAAKAASGADGMTQQGQAHRQGGSGRVALALALATAFAGSLPVPAQQVLTVAAFPVVDGIGQAWGLAPDAAWALAFDGAGRLAA
jgi:hypothetical protein